MHPDNLISSPLLKEPSIKEDGINHLFPVFLKLEQLRLLIVGGGNVGHEKLQAVLQNAPLCRVTVVATHFNQSLYALAEKYATVTLVEKSFETTDLDATDIVIVAVNDKTTSAFIKQTANAKGLLVNVADTPDACDFYLGSIVTKGHLKIAISTNGKSPTIAKRIKEYLNESLGDNIHDLIENMHGFRNQLKGDFAEKVTRLNEATKTLSYYTETVHKQEEKRWKKIATWCIFAFFFMFLGHAILSYIPYQSLLEKSKHFVLNLDKQFYLMILAGFLAQLVDGALGMGYGVISTIVLLSAGIPLPSISGSIHTAEMFSSGASGFSHYKFGNVNKKLFKLILAPGIIGAVLGAYLLSKYGTDYAKYIRPVLATYTLFLGGKIIWNAFKKNRKAKKLRRVGWLAGLGGFLDSFGGGGWGPLVTSTLIAKGKTPKYVIGTVSITEFFVTLASAVTFFSLIGISHWLVIIGLIIGGMLAAPIAAKLAGKLPLKTMFIAVGTLVVFWSLNILIRTLF